ncbi:MAG TPA: GAF domain-containing sensor histidine kinase, partial [Solirubrobacteraceae bacterium]
AVGTRMPPTPGSLAAQVFETERAARVDDFSTLHGPIGDLARAAGLGSGCAGPIVVNGALWGKMCAFSRAGTGLPVGTENRLDDFIELIATAIANYEERAKVERLAAEQSALRRVATLVAREHSPEDLFATLAEELGVLLGVDGSAILRYDPDSTATVVAGWSDGAISIPLGRRFPLEGESLAGEVQGTGKPRRKEHYEAARGPIAATVRELGIRAAVATPIVVEGATWGVIAVLSRKPEPLAPDTEKRLEEFSRQAGMAVANANSRSELAASEARARELADEQAALRRVATLVAQGASPDEVFSAVAREVAAVIEIPVVGVNRYEADGTLTILAIAGETNPLIGSNWPVQGVSEMVLASGRPSRQDDYTGLSEPLDDAAREEVRLAFQEPRSVVGVPIVVEGSVWGFMAGVAEPGIPIPAGTEGRLARFTELVATAVSNASTQTELLASRARLVSAADETRRRLERDLHDGIQQWLVALGLKARNAADLSPTGESAVQELSALADDLAGVTDELRELSRGIHPAVLSEAGLDDALEALARRSAIPVDLDVSFRCRYDSTLEATVYYVAAEAITNAVKHGQASTVTVRGGQRDGAIELEISDDGVGGADPRRGTGMIGLKDRVDTLGGTISFASAAGAGTTIRVKLPVGPGDGEEPPLPRPDEAASVDASG